MSTALMLGPASITGKMFKLPEKPEGSIDPKWKQDTINGFHELIRQFHTVVNAWRDNPQVGLEEVAGAAEGTGEILIAAAKQLRDTEEQQ